MVSAYSFPVVFSKYGYSLLQTENEIYPVYEELSHLLPTSGSTGSPKLVRHCYRNIEAAALNISTFFELTREEKALMVLPLYYTMGLSMVFSHLFVGATLLITDLNMTDRRFWQFMKDERATSFTGVPYSFEIMNLMRFFRMDFPDLKLLTQGGGKMPRALNLKFAEYCQEHGMKWIATYGQSEGTARMAFLPPKYAISKVGSIGLAVPNGELSLVDTDGNIIDKPNVEGEMCYRGKNVTLGYAHCIDDLLLGDERHGFMRTGDLAYRDEDEWKAANEREKQIAEMVARCPDIDCWAVDGETLTSSDYAARFEGFEGQTAYINVWYATPDFFRLYDLHFVEGGLPDTDDGWDECYVVNRAGLKALGYESCSGATVVDKDGDAQVYPIVGVIDNYYDGRITSGIRPMVFIVSRYTSGNIFQMVVHPGRLPAVLDYLRKLEREVYGTEEFEYYMFADRVRQMYESDRQTAVLYNVFAFMAIMVSCLGLFGISLFDMRQRYREIAIRKVNGAGRKELYRLLFRKYLLILGAAFLMAVPLSCYMIGIYTEGLTVKAPLTAGMFLFAFAVVTVLTVGTLFWQVHKAARINPAEVMKSE